MALKKLFKFSSNIILNLITILISKKTEYIICFKVKVNSKSEFKASYFNWFKAVIKKKQIFTNSTLNKKYFYITDVLEILLSNTVTARKAHNFNKH